MISLQAASRRRSFLQCLVFLLSARLVNAYSEVEKAAVSPDGEAFVSGAPVPVENVQTNASHYSISETAVAQECGDEAHNNDRSIHFDFGVEQSVSGDKSEEVSDLIVRTEEYMRNHVMVEPKYASVRDDCKNRHELCSFWSVVGECDANPAYMTMECAPACQTCEKLDVRVRCPLDPNAQDALGPGDLNSLFKRIISDPEFKKYKPTIVSRPSQFREDESKSTGYATGPWVVTFDDFLTAEEADRFIELAKNEGYERSTDVGSKKFDGTYGDYKSGQRTSENAWCQHACYEDEMTKLVLQRIENLTGIPDENSEYLQLLKYEENQFYGVHNDFIPYQIDRQCGPRILTFYMYLNDVEEGGGTNFPEIGQTVIPKKGKAVLWPSVLDEDPFRKDYRSDHQALPVVKGVKYGANAWIHARNFKEPNRIGCS